MNNCYSRNTSARSTGILISSSETRRDLLHILSIYWRIVFVVHTPESASTILHNDDMTVMVQRCCSEERDFDIRYGKLQARLFPIHETSFSVSHQTVDWFAHCAMFLILLMVERIIIGTVHSVYNDYYVSLYLQHFIATQTLKQYFPINFVSKIILF